MTKQDNPTGSEPRTTPTSSYRLIGTLGVIAFLSGLLVVSVVESTREPIAENHRRALERAVFEVVPGAQQQRGFIVTGEGLEPADEAQVKGPKVYAGYSAKGELQGIAIKASGRGYAGTISLLYGYRRADEQIVGMTILESRETPGLGDRIETNQQFLASFESLAARLKDSGAGLANEIVTVSPGEADEPGEIDGITGATVSAEAVGSIVNRSANQLLPLIAPHWADMQRGEDGLQE